jgi:hypothetical protein
MPAGVNPCAGTRTGPSGDARPVWPAPGHPSRRYFFVAARATKVLPAIPGRLGQERSVHALILLILSIAFRFSYDFLRVLRGKALALVVPGPWSPVPSPCFIAVKL